MLQQNILWKPAPKDLVLSRDHIHVFCASLDQPVLRIQQLTQSLSTDERVRAERFYFEQDQKRFIVGRGLLRTILSCYLDIEPSQLQFCYGRRGKPALAAILSESKLKFNLSHSQGLALYAIAYDCEIGVDIEHVRPIAEAEQIAERFFCVRENAVFRALPPNQKQEAFFNCWTRKEAYIKAIGDGLAWPLNQIEVSLAPGEPVRLLSIEGDPQEACYWSLQQLIPAPSYVGAIAVKAANNLVSCWAWP